MLASCCYSLRAQLADVSLLAFPLSFSTHRRVTVTAVTRVDDGTVEVVFLLNPTENTKGASFVPALCPALPPCLIESPFVRGRRVCPIVVIPFASCCLSR